MDTEAIETRTVRLVDRRMWDRDKQIHLYKVPWVCTVCGGPRGEVQEYNFTEDGKIYTCDTWTNPCGHRELHEHALTQAEIPLHLLPVRSIFEKLAESNNGMRLRESQIALSEGVDEIIRSKQWALMEAGTGTGKSKGYLVPIVASGRRSTISTATKALQDQVYFKDLQEVMQDLGVKRKVVLFKGAGNYLCKFRAEAMGITSDTAAAEVKELFDWAEQSPNGDLNDYPKEIEIGWGNVSVDLETCSPKKCKHAATCPWLKLKEQVVNADIVVTNHTLLFYSSETRNNRFVVIDEGHEIPKVAASVFSMEFSVRKMIDDLNNLSSYGDTTLRQFGLAKDHFTFWVGKLNSLALQMLGNKKTDGEKVKTSPTIFNDLRCYLGSHEDSNSPYNRIRAYISENPMENLSKRLSKLAYLHDFILTQSSSRDDLVRYAELSHDNITFRIGYRDVGPYLNMYLWGNEQVPGGVLLSASFKFDGYFRYMLDKLRLPEGTPTLAFPSPFDYPKQMRCYIPPAETMRVTRDSDYRQWLAGEIYKVVTAMKGRTVILFTSYKLMTDIYEDLKDIIPYNCLVQGGDKPNSAIKQEFIEDIHSVLFATKSFWTGFDAPGETLSCVIIPTIPFPQVGDPFTEAISSTLINPLQQYMVPEAAFDLHQGVGRLIRKEDDRGVIVFLDKRMRTASYASRFFNSMPPMQVTDSLEEVTQWLENK